MLISRDNKTVIYTPLKCGSTTLHDLLSDWVYVIGPHPYDTLEIDKHTDCVPWNAAIYAERKLLLIRNPFDRVGSLFLFYSQWHGCAKFAEWFETEFPRRFYDCPSVMYPRHSGVIRLEHLKADLAYHKIEVDEPKRLNESASKVVLPEWSRDKINKRYAQDWWYYPGNYRMNSVEKNLIDLQRPEQWLKYFHAAESWFESEWENMIWPRIQGFDFTDTVEIGPGGGRNTNRLLTLARNVTVVDVNQYCLDECERRFWDRVTYVLNDGMTLTAIEADSTTCVYSWDSMVHFDREIVQSYIKEIERILKPGGKAFLHHSNLGDKASDAIKDNPHWRSNCCAMDVLRYADESGLKAEQTIIDWGDVSNLDCITVLTNG